MKTAKVEFAAKMAAFPVRAVLTGKAAFQAAAIGRAALVAAAICVTAALPSFADGNRRPMALMVMFDGLRADAIESGEMPNLTALRNGTWQPGYNAAWTVTGQNAPGTPPVSAPNHASIATGVSPSKHGVTANGKTASGNYAAYPTWLKRVVDAKSGTSALFVYSWSEDADLGPAAGVTFLGKTDAENATDLAALLASSDAPDATMYFIDAVDHAGHAGSYYPYTAGYRVALAESDGYLGACLSAIASRAATTTRFPSSFPDGPSRQGASPVFRITSTCAPRPLRTSA